MEHSTSKKTWSLCVEYVNASNIHGVRFVGEKQRPLAEKVCWFTAVLISIVLCGLLINRAYNKWNDDPIIITFAGKYEPIGTIPLPAVTICFETKVRNVIFNVSATLEKMKRFPAYPFGLNATEISLMGAMMKVCDQIKIEPQLENKTLADEELLENLIKLSLDPLTTFVSCGNRLIASYNMCSMMLTQVITNEGVCYSFNVLAANELFREEAIHPKYNYPDHDEISEDWTWETGYESMDATYPVRVTTAHSKSAITFWIVLNTTDIDYACKSNQGLKISVHTPVEIPRLSKQFFRLPPNKFLSISIKPQVIKTSEDLRQYSPEKRQCFFNSERKLRYFKTYTQNNCEFECLTNFTERECGCVEFYMPRSLKTPFCGLASKVCTLAAEKKLLQVMTREQVYKTNGHSFGCNCLPSCNSIGYDTEMTMAGNIVSELTEEEKPSTLDMSRITIGFKRSIYMPMQRSAVTGPIEFISECGGLLGLFMGISFLSFIEIFYYFSLRLLVNLLRHKKKTQHQPSPTNAQ